MPIAAFTLDRPTYDTEKEWKFVAHAAGEHWQLWDALTASPSPLAFEGVTDEQELISIPEVHWNQQSRGRLEADVFLVRYSSQRPVPESPPSRQHIIVRLTPTPLAAAETGPLTSSWTGTLEPLPTSDPYVRAPSEISTALGTAIFSLTYSWENVDVAGARCNVRIPHATLRIDVPDESRRADAAPLMAAIDAAVEDALSVLSILSRRFVRWTSIQLTSLWESEERRDIEQFAWHRTVTGSKPRQRREPIVNIRRMDPKDLARLVATFARLPAKPAVSAAITYAIYVEDAPTIETALTSAFTCFETLVTGIDAGGRAGRLMPDTQFRLVRREVRSALGQLLETNEITETMLAAMLKKLPELQRAPIVDRAADLLERSNTKWRDLWPAGSELRDVLTRAFHRRNGFLHAGTALDPLTAQADSARLRILSERIVFGLIGASEQWMNPRAFDETRWLSSVSEASTGPRE